MSSPPQCGIPVKGGTPTEQNAPGVVDPPLADVFFSSPLETNPPRDGELIRYQCYGPPQYQSESINLGESRFRHSGWAPRRAQVWAALLRCGTGEKAKEAFANCGAALYVEVNEAGDDLRLRCNCCHSRWCVPCANTRAAILAGNLRDKLDAVPCRFVTLTQRHSASSLKDQIDRLYRNFAVLRRRESWRKHVTGGAAFFETKISERDGLWHVHLHVLCEGTWFDQRELSREWLAVTGDSSIVDIRPVGDSDARSRYVTKYVTKPADSSVFAQPAKLDEMIIALKGRRLVTTFGRWRGLKLEAKPERGKWTTVLRCDSRPCPEDVNRDDDPARWRCAAARKWPELARIFNWPKADTG